MGTAGRAASIALMVLHSFVPFPAEVLAIANGMLFGPIWGTVVTWVGAMLGAYLAFGLARLLGRPFVDAVVSERHRDVLDAWSERRGGLALVVSRLIPVISFNLINYAAGLTRIWWWTFTWATALGILPITIVMVSAGAGLRASLVRGSRRKKVSFVRPWRVLAAGLLRRLHRGNVRVRPYQVRPEPFSDLIDSLACFRRSVPSAGRPRRRITREEER